MLSTTILNATLRFVSFYFCLQHQFVFIQAVWHNYLILQNFTAALKHLLNFFFVPINPKDAYQNISRRQICDIFLILPTKQNLTIYVNHLLAWVTWIVKSYFLRQLGKYFKMFSANI